MKIILQTFHNTGANGGRVPGCYCRDRSDPKEKRPLTALRCGLWSRHFGPLWKGLRAPQGSPKERGGGEIRISGEEGAQGSVGSSKSGVPWPGHQRPSGKSEGARWRESPDLRRRGCTGLRWQQQSGALWPGHQSPSGKSEGARWRESPDLRRGRRTGLRWQQQVRSSMAGPSEALREVRRSEVEGESPDLRRRGRTGLRWQQPGQQKPPGRDCHRGNNDTFEEEGFFPVPS